ncbi:MAG: phage holin family protein [Acholeplasmataceae bacterium]|jgi:toxin secretion/phage lysis holin|nr:phage holin family protein [Acholeplasmataceae bacterium]
MKIKNLIVVTFGSIGSLLSFLLGGFDSVMIALLIFMVIDFLSGLILAIVFKKSKKTESGRLSSQAGILGLTKKIFILFLVAVSTQLDIILGTTFIRDGTVIGFISMEGISIIENASLAGLPIPKVIKNALEIISKKEKDKDKDE